MNKAKNKKQVKITKDQTKTKIKDKENKKENINEKSLNWMQKTVDAVEGFFLNIFKKIGLKKFVEWYLSHQEGMRYLVFGALATLVNIVVYDVFFYLFKVPNATSNIIAWIVAAVFAYFTNKMCVFNSKVSTKKALLYEIVSFFGCRFLTLIIDEAIMIVTVDKLLWNAALMKVLSNIIVIILNFVFSKVIIFKKGK